tara:strand:+ start:12116 stop:12403 length:288 start_codon:yes stop_codon:yes gene_type:complete
MGLKSKASKSGKFVCKIGYLDIRHRIEMPKEIKNRLGEKTKHSGSVEASVHHGSELRKGGFNDHVKAIKYAWEELKNDGKTHLVSKLLITKYKLS